MSKLFSMPAIAALALLSASGAHAASDADLEEIRAQIRELKSSYETRIQALEQRLKDAESRPAPVAAAPASIAPQPLPAPASSPTSSASAFNPAISAVLQGSYANLSKDPAGFRIAGFPSGGEIGPGRRGFSLGESEVALAANVDHLFSGNLILSVTPENTVAVEEAYGLFTAAPYGMAPKFGRFFSGIGYLNEQHQHAWDFVDAPLAYQAFLGGQYANDGVQVKWVAPLDQFFELGAEAGNGDGFPGTPRSRNGAGSTALYAHTGGDIGTSHSWRAGLSYLRTGSGSNEEARFDTVTDNFGNDALTGFSGRSRLAIADFVWKYAPNGNARSTNFKLQGEYIQRRESGDLTYALNGVADSASVARYAARQSGWYVQGIYQFMPMWRVGARYDRLDAGSVDYGANAAFLPSSSFDPERYSVMLDWTPSEFSRVRLQLAQSKTQPGITDTQWFLQYILSLGAHGAHKY
jgi:hypothetical protein